MAVQDSVPLELAPPSGGTRVVGALRTLRRLPTIPMLLLILLLVTGVFAPLIAPHDERVGSLNDKGIPPFWVGSESELKIVVSDDVFLPEANKIKLRAAVRLQEGVQVGDQIEVETKRGGSANFILGTDHLGRDMLSRIIFGARISLIVAAVTLGIGGTVGTFLGLLAGYHGGWVDEIIMRLVDIKLSIPLILFALVMVLTFGQSFEMIVIILILYIWPRFARQIRGEVLQIKNMDYVALAKVSGASTWRIMFKHVFPGTINTLIVVATLQVGFVILVESTLSFLGAGVPPPTPAWGSMVADGRDFLALTWWEATIPAVAIFLTVMSLNLFGDWLRDRLDPRLRQLD